MLTSQSCLPEGRSCMCAAGHTYDRGHSCPHPQAAGLVPDDRLQQNRCMKTQGTTGEGACAAEKQLPGQHRVVVA